MSQEYNTNNFVILYKDVLKGFIPENIQSDKKDIIETSESEDILKLEIELENKIIIINNNQDFKSEILNDDATTEIVTDYIQSNQYTKSNEDESIKEFVVKKPIENQIEKQNEYNSNPFDCVDFDLLPDNSIDGNTSLDGDIDLEKDNYIVDTQGHDPWEDAINDNKFYINNRIARIFPVLKNFNNYAKIKIDDDSFSYITVREIAEYISKIVCYHLLKYNVNPQKSLLIDYTSGVGGNVLSFCKCFNKVIALELVEERCDFLINNISVYGYKNITVINKSAIVYNEESMIEVNPNVIFIDPPWGGNDYKNSDTLLLKLGELSIEELAIKIIEKFSSHYKNKIEENNDEELKSKIINNNYNNKLIVLKLPKNYDIEYFYNYIKEHSFPNYVIIPYLYVLNKMLIIILELSYY